ncbi:MAG: NifU family protein [Acidiphilium sp.]|nr:NifU family protein [Acidiphilium sp.]MDD4935146.1 NifU family protein [Acidiphilium sp.]
MLVVPQQTRQPEAIQDARTRLIEDVIAEIRPNLKRDGGDCVLLGVEGNKIMVRLSGACVFCKLSSATLEGIQSRIVERLGELVRVIPVMGGVMANS